MAGNSYLVNVVRTRNFPKDNGVWVDTFRVAPGIKDPEKALRDAVKAFLQTERGKKAIIDSSNDFNWGDAMLCLSANDLAVFGIERVQTGSEDIVVDQDEVLCK